MKRLPFLLVALVLVLFTWSCGTDAQKEDEANKITIEINTETDDIKRNVDEGMRDMEEGLKEGLEEMTSGLAKMMDNLTEDENGETVPAADFRDLKALLPDRLLRMERTSHSGERSGIKGLQVSVAKAEYEDDERYLEVNIVDGGGFPLAGLANAGWLMVEVDKEDSNGYERTTTIDGSKAFEKYNTKWKEGELVVFHEDRFIVTLKGKGLEADDLRRVLDRLNLDKLEEL